MGNMKKIIIDTDIGDDIDDAYALVTAVRMRCFDLLGVTTVYRNSFQRAKIASALLGGLGRTDVGVYVGNDYPYREHFCVESFENCLPDGRPVIPHYSSTFERAPVCIKPAAEFIADQAERYPGEITIVAIGPLTNIADTARKYPEAYLKLAEIVCMGGSFVRDKAEWNIRCDPEAASAVVQSGVPIRFVGVDVTSYTYLGDEELKRATAGTDSASEMLKAMIAKWMDTHPGRRPTMHDALTVAEVNGGFCDYVECGLIIPLEGPYRAFTCRCDRKDAAKVSYAVNLDRAAFMEFFLKTLEMKTTEIQGGGQ